MSLFQDTLQSGKAQFRLALLVYSYRQSWRGLFDLRIQPVDITETILTKGLKALRPLAQAGSIEHPQVWAVQGDLLDELTLAALDSVVQLALRIEPAEVSVWNDSACFIVHLRYSRTWEHIERESVLIKQGQVSRLEVTKHQPASLETTLPASTFDLGLSQAQKEQKDALDLPHLRRQQPAGSGAPAGPRPILADDFDDLDPDADLDI